MITFRGVRKQFGGVVALQHVTLEIARGACHGLLGENGAGKSTLGKVLAGIHRPDAGTLEIDGKPRLFVQPADALAAGVGMVHQELSFCPDLSVSENLALGRWPRRGGGPGAAGAAGGAVGGAPSGPRWLRPFIDRREQHRRARALLARIGVELDVSQPVGALPVAAEQLVQVAAALGTGADILVFDEATSALTEAEAERLYALVEELRADGLTVIWITHRLHEVQRLCDRATVLRDGRAVATLERVEAARSDAASTDAVVVGSGVASPFDADELVKHMIGRSLVETTPPHLGSEPGPVRLSIEGLSSAAGCHDVSLQVQAGEIVGLAGLVGAGRSELLRAVFGLDRVSAGRVSVDGRELGGERDAGSRGSADSGAGGSAHGGRWSAQDAMAAGLGLVPEDRKRQGLVLGLSGRENFSLADLRRWRRGPFLLRGRERRAAQEAYQRLGVRAPSVETPVAALSGGNQQKVVLARWLARAPRRAGSVQTAADRARTEGARTEGARADGQASVLLVDEPTRGVDVGAKESIHALLSGRAAEGAAVLMASSDMPELLHLCTRIIVLREGRVVGERTRRDADEDSLMRMMAGLSTAPAP